MKKIFFICCVAVSSLALAASTNANKHQHFFNNSVVKDTAPRPMLDTAPNTWKDTARNNLMKDTGMMQQRDSTRPAPPKH